MIGQLLFESTRYEFCLLDLVISTGRLAYTPTEAPTGWQVEGTNSGSASGFGFQLLASPNPLSRRNSLELLAICLRHLLSPADPN